MKAYNSNFIFSNRENWEIIDLSSDLMVFPIVGEKDIQVCHSDSTGKWYILQDNITPRENEDITSALLTSGCWLDCYPYIPEHFAYVPFHWGEAIKSKLSDNIQYIPIWEHIPTGEYYTEEDDDFACLEKYIYVYKIIMVCSDPFKKTSNNVIESNYHTMFETFEYKQDIKKMISDLQLFTGKEF